MCRPGLTIEQFLDGSSAFVEPVFRAIDQHLRAVDADEDGDLIVDPLENKVLFKNGPTFCIIDVKSKWVAVGFSLLRSLSTDRLSRKTIDHGDKFHHVVNVDDPEVIDEEFLGWLTEAYLQRPTPGGAMSSSFDPMVPDDIDFEIAPPH